MSTSVPSNLSPAEEVIVTLTAAKPRDDKSIAGRFIFCVSAAEDFQVAVNNGGLFPFGANRYFEMPEGQRFEKLALKRKSGAAVDPNEIQLVIGDGDYRTASFSLAGSITLAAGQTVKLTKPTTLITPADVVLVAATNTLLFAANANATRRTIRNTHATVDLRVSTTAADLTAGRGKLVKAGEEWETDVSGALYGRAAGTPTLVLAEESF